MTFVRLSKIACFVGRGLAVCAVTFALGLCLFAFVQIVNMANKQAVGEANTVRLVPSEPSK